MENGAISDEQITASSQYNADEAAKQGRLFFQETATKSGGWVAATSDSNQWLQIDLRTLSTKVTRVATQGRNGVNRIDWVTSYMLQYSKDGVTFHYYRERGETADKVKPTVGDQVSVINTVNCKLFFSLSVGIIQSHSGLLIHSSPFLLFLATLFSVIFCFLSLTQMHLMMIKLFPKIHFCW